MPNLNLLSTTCGYSLLSYRCSVGEETDITSFQRVVEDSKVSLEFLFSKLNNSVDAGFISFGSLRHRCLTLFSSVIWEEWNG